MAGQNREFEGKFVFLGDILPFWWGFEDILEGMEATFQKMSPNMDDAKFISA